MANYVMGDVQGCFMTFIKLLEAISFDAKTDRMILLGDLFNRGKNSLEMARYLIKNQDAIDVVLGNHDIFALALFLGAKDNTRTHTLQALLAADDAPEIFSWLRKQPLIIKRGNNVFVHAGILPARSVDEALIDAEAVQEKLRGDGAKKFLRRFYEDTPYQLVDAAKKNTRLTLAYTTLIRLCADEKTMDFSYNGTLAQAPEHLYPWFDLRHDDHYQIFFGHWAALGLVHEKNYHCLDSGCVWGRSLTAIRLDDMKVFQVKSVEGG